MRKLLIIAGVPIDDMTLPEVLDRVAEYIQARTPHQIATVNADFVLKAWDDAELRHILNDADILTADGMPLIWGARLLGVNLKGRVTGADLVPALAERGAREGWRFFLLGGKPGIAERAADNLSRLYPGFNVVGMYSPPFAPVAELTAEINRRIHAAQPDILLVAFGNPKQEKWIHMHLGELNVPASFGVGGALDFAAGEIPRAPLWMQNAGLEWLFRLIQEPGRMWKRYVLDMVYFTHFFLVQWWRQLRGRQFARSEISPKEPVVLEPPKPGFAEICLSGMLTSNERGVVQPQIEQALHAPGLGAAAGVRLDMRAVRFIDSAGMGMFVNLTKEARALGKELRLEGLNPEIRTTLRMLKLDSFLSVERAESPQAADETAPRLENGWLVFSMPPRLEAAIARDLPTRIEQGSPNGGHIVADFSKTSFIDSAGIAALLSIQRSLQARAGQLCLAGMGKEQRRVFDLSGVARLFSFQESAAAAVLEPIKQRKEVI